jgi:hypothetical protein
MREKSMMANLNGADEEKPKARRSRVEAYWGEDGQKLVTLDPSNTVEPGYINIRKCTIRQLHELADACQQAIADYRNQ